MSSTTTSSATGAATTTGKSDGGGGGGGPASSPLLFFVALGFGVVFTNLWIIVGVKYCFRYNQRNRQLRNEETGDPIDLVTMPRTHRRRREKKLMTMDEVNDRFPLIKYKAWRSSRASEGLSTTGGISAPSSRPQSLKQEVGITTTNSEETKGHHRTDSNTSQSSAPVQHAETVLNEPDEKAANAVTCSVHEQSNPAFDADHPEPKEPHNQAEYYQHGLGDDEDTDDPIRTALPAELLPNPGDSCAICIDGIEDDDDIRGLTCGHAFHASCVDPWLTSRKACCPLCKADYYIPKPRPEGADAAQNSDRRGRSRARGRGPNPPQAALTRGRVNPFRTTMMLHGRFSQPSRPEDRGGLPRPGGLDTSRRRNDGHREPSQQRSWAPIRLPHISFRSFHLPSWHRSPRENQDPTNDSRTLRQLEAGSNT